MWQIVVRIIFDETKKHQGDLMRTFMFGILFFLASCASVKQGTSSQNSADLLAKVSMDPKTFGDLIYTGELSALKGDRSQVVYSYDRRVRAVGPIVESSAVTKEGGKVVLVETAVHNANYELSKFTEYQLQLGEVGVVEVDGKKVRLTSIKGRSQKTASEDFELPVVPGPVLYGFIYKNWMDLIAGKSVAFKIPVFARMETIAFELVKVDAKSPDLVSVQMRPSSAIIRAVVDPMIISFKASNKELVSFEGRVPTKIRAKNSWADFDAFIKYKSVAKTFR
jgi:hypothetical protein